MSIYQRTTRKCSVTQIKPELRQALQAFFQKHDLGNLVEESLSCCETRSESQPGSWLSSWLDDKSETEISSAIVLTARSLVWARVGNQSPARVAGADLRNIRAKIHLSLFSKEPGLEVSGLLMDAKNVMHGVIALGPEPAAQVFCEEVQQAIEKINPTPERKWPAWMGGR